MACKDNDANCIVYSVTHLFVRVGRIDNYILVFILDFKIVWTAEKIKESCLEPIQTII